MITVQMLPFLSAFKAAVLQCFLRSGANGERVKSAPRQARVTPVLSVGFQSSLQTMFSLSGGVKVHGLLTNI